MRIGNLTRHSSEIDSGTKWTPERVSALSRAVAITGIGAIALGILAAFVNSYYIGAMAAAALLLVLVWWQFETALAVYALIAFIPMGQTPDLAVGLSGSGRGICVSEVMLAFLIIMWLLRYLVSSLPEDRIRSGFHIPLALYLVYSVVNVVHSFLFWDPNVSRYWQHPLVNGAEISFRALSAGAFAIYATSIGSPAWLKWTTIAVMAVGAYNLVHTLLGGPLGVGAPWWPLVALPLLCYCWAAALDHTASPAKRVIGAAVVACGVFVILVRDVAWVSGWLGVGVGLITVTFVRNRRVFWALVVMAGLALVIAWPLFMQDVVKESEEGGDFDRFGLMANSWKYATTFPLGVGIGNYRSYQCGYYGRLWGLPYYGSAHGTYAQHLTEMGIPGTFLLVWLLVGGFRWMLAEYRRAQPGFSRDFLVAVLGQCCAIAFASIIGDYIIPTYHNGAVTNFSATVYCWMVWGLAVSHVRLARTKPAGEADAQAAGIPGAAMESGGPT